MAVDDEARPAPGIHKARKRRRVEAGEPVSGVDGAAAQKHATREGRTSSNSSLQESRQKLPIWEARAKVLAAVGESCTLILVAETGSGKTTQIPQILFEAGYGAIACTQPRRVAAVTIARRVALEQQSPLGGLVGYSIRFDDKTSQDTRIKYMTDGMLLREALVDPDLKKYQVVVLDEAHERTVQTDVLLGLVKGIQARRDDGFRLIVMSATLDAGRFADYFPGSATLHVEGRQHAVEVFHTAEPEDSYMDAALAATLQVHEEQPPGDVLVFLTGQVEIESLQRLLKARTAQASARPGALSMLALPIYAALPPEQQMRVFEPAKPGTRKVILATNIAETSITVPGVRYVIDPGLVKARAYHPRLRADSLQVVPVSQAQARQRSGRAGREAPGKAFRLYTEGAFRSLASAAPPEVQRSNLATVVLQLKALGVADPLAFDFMDLPPKYALLRALELLYALGALDAEGKLSDPIGRQLARLPVDPMYGAVLLAAARMGCAADAIAVVATASVDAGVFLQPRNKKEAAEEAQKRFVSREGDHTTLLNVYRAYAATPPGQRPAWCADNFISGRAMARAADIHAQLAGHLQQMGLPLESCGQDMISLRRALTCGLFPHSAKRQQDGSYKLIASGQLVAVHPSSVLSSRKPECIVFNELIHTTRQYARDVTVIDVLWLPELVPAFFKRQQEAMLPRGRLSA